MTNPMASNDSRLQGNEPAPSVSRRGKWLDEAALSAQRAMNRRIRLGALALIVLAFAGLFWWQLVAPFQHVNAHFLMMSGERSVTQPPAFDEQNLLMTEAERTFVPPDFVAEDFRAMEPLKSVLSLKTKTHGTRSEGDLQELLDPRRLSATLEDMTTGDSDVLMLLLSMRTVVEDGEPEFVLNVHPGFIEHGHCRLEEVLQKVAAIDAAVKLLFVDAGRFLQNPSQGALLNDFPRLLERAVQQTNDDRLWVLVSNQSLERSHISRSLERSVFGWFLTLGLSGAADFNHDWVIDLDELSRFVATEVSEFVRQSTGGAESQSPQLYWGGGTIKTRQVLPVILPVAKNRIESFRVEEPQKWLQASQQLSVSSSYSLVPNSPVTFQPNVTIPQSPLTNALISPSSLTSALPLGANIPGLGTMSVNPASLSKPMANRKTPAKDGKEKSADPGSDRPTSADPGEAKLPGDDKSSSESANDPKATVALATLFIDTWNLRDQLESGAGEGLNPALAAPQEWRLLVERLLLQGELFRGAGISDREKIRRIVQTLHNGLKALTKNESIPYQPDNDERTSEVIRRIHTRMNNHPGLAIRPYSFGMAELLARTTGQPINSDIEKAMTKFDQWFDSGTVAEFEEWLEKLGSPMTEFVEVQLARRLAAQPMIGWPTKQIALRVCRIAEKTAALRLDESHWVGPDFNEAEHLRKIGERTLLDQIGHDRESEGSKYLLRALAKYVHAARDFEQIAAAEFLCDDLVSKLPDYVRWRNRSTNAVTGAPESDDLRELVEELSALIARLDMPEPEQISDVQNLAARLGSLRERLEEGIEPDSTATTSRSVTLPGDDLPIEAVLTTSLPSGANRLRMLKSLMDIDRQNVAQVALPHLFPSILEQRAQTISDWEWPMRQLELELLVPQIGAVNVPSIQSEFAELRQAFNQLREARVKSQKDEEKANSGDLVWEQYHRFSNRLKQYYQTWKGQLIISASLKNVSSEIQARKAQRQTLRSVQRGLALLPTNYIRLDEIANPTPMLELLNVYDVLTWHAERYEAYRTGSPRTESSELASTANGCRTQAARLPLQLSMLPVNSPKIKFEGENKLSLEEVVEQTFELPLLWTGTPKTPTWICVHYDKEFVDVKASSEFPVQLDSTTAYIEPAVLMDKLPSFEVSADKPVTLRLAVRRRDGATGEARLICYAVTAGESTRHDIHIVLPTKPTLDLVIEGIAGAYGSSDQRLRLFPFPNHQTDYTLSLINKEPRVRELTLQVLAPLNPVRVRSPHSELSTADLAKLLDNLGPVESLIPRIPVNLPEGTTPVRIPFPKPVPKPPEKEGAAKPVAPLAPHGFVLLISDTKTGNSFVEIVDIAPQRPRRFLHPKVRYDADRERIEISVVPIDPSLMPADGVKVLAEIVPPLSGDAIRELEGFINGPRFECNLFAEVPKSIDRVVALQITVDDYPRGFLYRVPCQRTTSELPEILDAMSASITAPKPMTAFQSPLETLPVELKVDAPDGAFLIPGDKLEVGIDRDNDRDFRTEPVLTLRTDRQVAVRQIAFLPDGHLELTVNVSDFHVEVPASGVRNSNTQLLARLNVSDRIVYSQPIPIVVDGTGPKIQRVRQSPAGPVVAAAPLKIIVSASDNDLSGVAKIELAADIDRNGQISPTAPVIIAEPTPDGSWVADFPTAELKPGPQTVLLRGIDRTGNVGEVTRLRLMVISKEEATKLSMQPVSVIGLVQFQDKPIAGIQMSAAPAAPATPPPPGPPTTPDLPKIEPTITNEQGQFELKGLIPGKWKIKATGVVRNKTRTVITDLEIKPATPPQPLKMLLK